MLKVYRSSNSVLFHTFDAGKAVEYLNTDLAGLSGEEVEKRKQIYGSNILEERIKKSLLERFLDQFKNVMVLILLAAAIIAIFVGDYKSTAIILFVVIMNATLGVIQENKAEKALEALKSMSSHYTKVKRNGQISMIKSDDLTLGDIVILEAGDYVPADMRLVETVNLKIEEAALTGESIPVEKFTESIDRPDIVIGDRRNMAYLGSAVVYGRGIGVVTSVGINTEIGKIAKYLSGSGIKQDTPLQRKLAEIGKYVSIIIIVICLVIFIAGKLWGRDTFEMFLTAVSLAVAAIPEGLPAIVTIVLALGVQKMAKRNAIVRKLPAVETLGSTEIICSDKTGTLTLNRMKVQEVYIDGSIKPADELTEDSNTFPIFIHSLILCNDTKTSRVDKEKLSSMGDPTEVALVDFAVSKGFYKDLLDKLVPRIREIPFDSGRKLMTTINQLNGKLRVITKGAPDVLLEKCSRIMMDGKVKTLSLKQTRNILEVNRKMAGNALRVLAVAIKDIDKIPSEPTSENIEDDLIFVGLVGMIDPPRPEAKEAVSICLEAGIRPIMITGDHKDTAIAIAKELGIVKDEGEVITGSELNAIPENVFENEVSKYSVYARVSPEHKVQIVNAWRKKDKIVAMTGDGVNDAPAMKAADISIGMGITGTDVAKGVSDIVLADDNFATIVTAVEEGRKIYSNIRKAVLFLLSTHLGEVFTLFIATMLNWVILYPIHLLWVNLIIDTLPALALGLEKTENGIMRQKPRKSSESFFSNGLGTNIVSQGILKGIITLFAYYLALKLHSPEAAVTTAFATLGLIQLAHALTLRSETKSIFKLGLFSNMYLVGAIALSSILQLTVIAVPFLNGIFMVKQLNFQEWIIVVVASLSIIPIVEVFKFIKTRKI